MEIGPEMEGNEPPVDELLLEEPLTMIGDPITTGVVKDGNELLLEDEVMGALELLGVLTPISSKGQGPVEV